MEKTSQLRGVSAIPANSALLGRQREQLVARALLKLRRQGYLYSFELSAPNGLRDRKGVDAVFWRAPDQKLVQFQIKGSEGCVRNHLLRHPEIPCVNVGDCVTVEKVQKLLRETFGLQKFKKGAIARRRENRERVYVVCFLPIEPTEKCRCINNTEKYQCRNRAILQVRGFPHIQCCKSKKCRKKAKEAALRCE